jgi:hypothetical protein
MWRFGFPNPVNYDDNEVFCGGYGGNTLMTSFKALRKRENTMSLISTCSVG